VFATESAPSTPEPGPDAFTHEEKGSGSILNCSGSNPSETKVASNSESLQQTIEIIHPGDSFPSLPQKRRASDSFGIADATTSKRAPVMNTINVHQTQTAEPERPHYDDRQHTEDDHRKDAVSIPGCSQSQHYHVGMDDCLCSCHCRFSPEELQWATPGDASKVLGISTAILRSLAVARVIPVFIRPSGQRMYNLPSIRKFISEHTLQPKCL